MSHSTVDATRILVTGAGGFIGHQLVTFLKQLGYWVRGADLKLPEFSLSDADEFCTADLRRWSNCLEVTKGVDEVYALAADMGGMGFISKHHGAILHNNVLINTHTLEAARLCNVQRYLYTSSACVYPEYRQMETDVIPLKEEDAYPARLRTPMDGKNSFLNACAATTARITDWKRGLCVFTTFSVHPAPGMGDAKKLRRHSAVRWRSPSSLAIP